MCVQSACADVKFLPGDEMKSSDNCNECGGMGLTIGFLGDKKILYKCETCNIKPRITKTENITHILEKSK